MFDSFRQAALCDLSVKCVCRAQVMNMDGARQAGFLFWSLTPVPSPECEPVPREQRRLRSPLPISLRVQCGCPAGLELIADMRDLHRPEAFLLFSATPTSAASPGDQQQQRGHPLTGVKEAWRCGELSVTVNRIY
ncbi:low-density lipoprotein receptor-related protein 6 isoform X1 [Lates japonicus]|uniref:Low-density lipoprotein receptor-related protein 6 isoform X1 n=1 Tax=Lates japonicus TaxID=270547 RepID=A0AAD3RJV5_LATJO|nr:low-density lipoprotein receptor-related protein 6 isoform X1 [Lates japonicus]